ncbi:MAG: type II toxin-antitoxin system RelE/ParE family toxin [Gammaproteobacteria bacterium]|nr:type II toxin-antitoxin system RelE/ParE family toxin [Gammaproteobacteria bacterium]
MKVFWTAEARTRLLEIQAYVAQRSPKAARQVAAGLLRRTRQLESAPLTGRSLPEYPAEEMRELLERPYRLIYRLTSEQVEIVTVKHYRQRLPRDPRQLAPR